MRHTVEHDVPVRHYCTEENEIAPQRRSANVGTSWSKAKRDVNVSLAVKKKTSKAVEIS